MIWHTLTSKYIESSVLRVVIGVIVIYVTMLSVKCNYFILCLHLKSCWSIFVTVGCSVRHVFMPPTHNLDSHAGSTSWLYVCVYSISLSEHNSSNT